MKKFLLTMLAAGLMAMGMSQTFAATYITGTGTNQLAVLAGEVAEKGLRDTGYVMSTPAGDYIVMGIIVFTIASVFFFRKK